MKDLLEHIVSSLLENGVYEILESSDGDNIRFTLKVDPEFIGLMIGKEGKTVKSLRNILRIKAVLENKGVYLEVVEKDDQIKKD